MYFLSGCPPTRTTTCSSSVQDGWVHRTGLNLRRGEETGVCMFMVGCAHLSRWAGAQVFCSRLSKGQLAARGPYLVILWTWEGVRSEVKQPLQ